MRKIFFAAVVLVLSVPAFSQTGQKKDSLHVILKEITVSSIRAGSKSAVSYTNLSEKELEKTNLGQDIPYLLSLTPSFVATSDAGTGIGYTGYRIRGTDANRVNVTVNGVPLNDSESHTVFFVNMPDFTSSLSSVQIQRGVGTSTNGAAAFGASINMQTEGLNYKPYAEISTTYGSFNTNKNTLRAGSGLINKLWAFDARLSNVTSDGYIDRAWVDMRSYYFSAGYYGDKTTLKLLTFGGNEKTYQAWNGVYADLLATDRTYNELGAYTDEQGNEQFYENQTDNYAQTHYQLHLNQIINQNLLLNATLHYTRGKGYYEEYKSDRWVDEYGLTPDTILGQAQWTTDLIRRKWLDNHFGGLVFGLNYSRDQLQASLGGGINRYAGDHFGRVIWARNAQNLDPHHEWYRSSSVKDDGNIFLKANYTLWDMLNLSADIQYRYIRHKMQGQNDKFDWNTYQMIMLDESHTFHFLNPKFGLTCRIDDQQDVYASWSVAHREPNRNNYTEAGVNEKPVPERLTDHELGYRFTGEKAVANINAYFMKYKDQLVLTGKVSEIGELLTSNVADSYRAGIEMAVSVAISPEWQWGGNLTVSENKIKNFSDVTYIYDTDYNVLGQVDSLYKLTNIGYSPELIANSVFTYHLNNFEASFMTQFVGRQYLDNTSTLEKSIDPYFVNNLSLKYHIPQKLINSVDIQLLVNNIFNEKYESNGYAWSEMYPGDSKRYHYKYLFPQAGINFLASLTLKF